LIHVLLKELQEKTKRIAAERQLTLGTFE